MIEASFNTTSLSDVGCTFRVLTKDLVRQLEPDFRHTGSAFGLEMLLLATRRQVRVVQIPVNYLPRVGESSVTGTSARPCVSGSRWSAWSRRPGPAGSRRCRCSTAVRPTGQTGRSA
jgi:hypothetical protein